MKDTDTTSQQKLDGTTNEEFILGSLFLISNQLQTLLDRAFEPYGLTAKQWFLSIIVGGVFNNPPTLGEAAAVMGSTHQNVKQVALKLQEKGFLEFLDDERDGRAVRLRLTQKSDEFWMGMQGRSEEFMAGFYKDLSAEEMAVVRSAFGKIMINIKELDEEHQRIRRDKK